MAVTKEEFVASKREKIAQLQKEAMDLMLQAESVGFPNSVTLLAMAKAVLKHSEIIACHEFVPE